MACCLPARGARLFVAALFSGLLPSVCLAAAGSADVVRLAESGFTVKVPQAATVPFRGMVNADRAGMAGGPVLYPAPGLAGFLAAIATHGVLVESSRSSEKSRQQVEADRVLEPYARTLSELSHGDLLERALAGLNLPPGAARLAAADATPTGWVLESLPTFTMSQDRSALVLDNAVVVYAADQVKTPRLQTLVRVVSHLRKPAETPAMPASLAPAASDAGKVTFAAPSDDGQVVRDSVDLMATSLRVVLDELARDGAPAEAKPRTFRYREGATARMERGQLVQYRCDRLVIRTLRGWLMSVPVQPGEELDLGSPCVASPAQ